MRDENAVKEQLRLMDEQLSAMIAFADGEEDFLLGALLSDAHEAVIDRYRKIVAV